MASKRYCVDVLSSGTRGDMGRAPRSVGDQRKIYGMHCDFEKWHEGKTSVTNFVDICCLPAGLSIFELNVMF